jgi:hypothetical protein
MKHNLEQSLWFDDIDLEKNDTPVCNIIYTNSIDDKTHISYDYNLFDCIYGFNRYINLTELFKANEETTWKAIMERIQECDSITIVNDITTDNDELSFITDFYVRVFYSDVKSHCSQCYLYEKTA